MSVGMTGAQKLRITSGIPASAAAWSVQMWVRKSGTTGSNIFVVCVETDFDDAFVFVDDTTGDLLLYDIGFNSANFSAQPGAVPYALTVTGESGVFRATWRDTAGNSGTASLATNTNGAVTAINVGNFEGTSVDYGFPGRVWNVKCWDRTLSNAEAQIEGFYRSVKFPSSLLFHWRLPNASRTEDSSGNGSNPSISGTLTSEVDDFQPWKPSAQILVPSAAAPASVAGSMLAKQRLKSLVNAGLVQ